MISRAPERSEWRLSMKRQRGAATLFVTVIILALLTVIAITVTRIGMLELKTASNTNRAKEALHTAQGGLDYGAMKYLNDPDAWTPTGTESIFIPGGSATQVDVAASVASSFVEISAVGESNDQTGSANLKERYGIVPVIDFGELPPLMAGGNFPPGGTFSIVGNPNGGGSGVPVSAWIKQSDPSGVASWQTCNLDEFLYEGTNISQSQTLQTDGFVTCDTCRCQQADNPLCEAQNGVDPGSCDDIVVDACVPDTFENLFGANVFDNDDLGASCEPETGTVDETLWTTYRDMGLQYEVACSDLDQNTGDIFYSGGTAEGELPLIWIEGDCTIPANTQVGSYEHPFILVIHGDVTMNSNSSFYGILFAFSDIYTATEDYDITVNGSPIVYGVMVINGDVDLPTGSFTMVYSNNILEKLSNKDGDYNELARFPGSWTDIK